MLTEPVLPVVPGPLLLLLPRGARAAGRRTRRYLRRWPPPTTPWCGPAAATAIASCTPTARTRSRSGRRPWPRTTCRAAPQRSTGAVCGWQGRGMGAWEGARAGRKGRKGGREGNGGRATEGGEDRGQGSSPRRESMAWKLKQVPGLGVWWVGAGASCRGGCCVASAGGAAAHCSRRLVLPPLLPRRQVDQGALSQGLGDGARARWRFGAAAWASAVAAAAALAALVHGRGAPPVPRLQPLPGTGGHVLGRCRCPHRAGDRCSGWSSSTGRGGS